MASFVARQPIFYGNMEVYGYELLYRKSDKSMAFDGTDPDKASTETIINAFQVIGIEKMTGGKQAFINFTENLLQQQVATLFPSDILMVEILEDVPCTPENVEACRMLKQQGYKIALDDFEYVPEYMPFIELADIIKFDFMNTPLKEIFQMIIKLKGHNLRFLAEKVETQEEFDLAVKMGFSYFQGYFFSKPVILSGQKIDPLKVNYIQLMHQVNDLSFDFRKTANIVKRDVALSYNLLRLVNSPYFGVRNKITNVQQALVHLGEKETRKWVSLISMMGLRGDKPDELIRMSLVRGHFLELLADKVGLSKKRDELFMLGILSLIDVMTNQAMDQVIDQIHLPGDISNSLVSKKGKMYRLLMIITHYEKGEWSEAMEIANDYNLSSETLFETYVEATSWASELVIS